MYYNIKEIMTVPKGVQIEMSFRVDRLTFRGAQERETALKIRVFDELKNKMIEEVKFTHWVKIRVNQDSRVEIHLLEEYQIRSQTKTIKH